MENSKQMMLIGMLAVLGVLIVVGIIVLLSPEPHSARQSVQAKIMAQSKTYIETLGSKPFETLSSAQQLLVLHAYYNLGHYTAVVQRAEAMVAALQQLPPERKQAFAEMVQTAYQHLGKPQEAAAFGKRLGL